MSARLRRCSEQFVERVSAGAPGGQDAGIGVGAGPGLGQDLFEGQRFEALDAQQAAAGLGHLVDEEVLVFGAGLELVAQMGGEAVEVFGVLVGKDGEDAGETMAGRVAAGDLFTFRRVRAGRVCGILPVGEDLCCGAHPTPIISGELV